MRVQLSTRHIYDNHALFETVSTFILLYMSSNGSGESAGLHRLVLSFTSHIYENNHKLKEPRIFGVHRSYAHASNYQWSMT